MRRTEPVPGDLVLSGLLALMAIALMAREGSAYQPVGFLMFGCAIAYSLISALLPEDIPEAPFRLGGSLSAGVVMAALSRFFPISWPWWAASAILAAVAILLVVAYGRRRAVPRRRRFFLQLPSLPNPGKLEIGGIASRPRGLSRVRPVPGKPKGAGGWTGLSQRVRIALALLLILSASVLAYYRLSGDREGYTDLYITGLSGQVEAGRAFSPVFGLVNQEGGPMSYNLQVRLGDDILAEQEVGLDDNRSWEEPIPLILSDPGEQELHVVLYRQGESTPYRQQQVRITVIKPSPSWPNETAARINMTASANASNQSATASVTAQANMSTKRSSGRSSGTRSSSSSGGGGSSSSSAGSSSASTEEDAALPSLEGAQPQAADETDSNSTGKNDSADLNQSQISTDVSFNNTTVMDATVTTTVTNATATDMAVSQPKATPSAPQAWTPSDQEDSADQPSVILDETASTEGQTNRTPIVTALVPSPDSPSLTGVQVTWTAQGFDADGDTLYYRFLVDNKTQTAWSTENIWTWQTRGILKGHHNVTVLVRDGRHAAPGGWDDAATYEYQLTLPNRQPRVTSVRPDLPSPQTPGTTVTWTAQASDPDEDRMSFRFLINGLVIQDWSPSPTWIWNTTGYPTGVHNLTVLVRDERTNSSDQLTSSQQARYTLQARNKPPAQPNQSQIRSSVTGLEEPATAMADDRPPMASGLSPSPGGPVSAGTEVIWTAQAIDPDMDPISYRFYLEGMPATGWSSSPTWSWNTSGKDPGEYQVTVWVRDGFNAPVDGYDGQFSATISLVANQPPKLDSLTPRPAGPQKKGTEVIWTAAATDPDGDKIVYRFFLDERAATGWNESPSWTWDTSSASPGQHVVEVRVRDGRHSGPDGNDDILGADYALSAGNSPPALVALSADPPSPGQPGSRINWSASAKDPDGDPLIYMFQQDGKDTTTWTSSPSWSWDTSDLLPGSYSISVLVRDQNHAGPDGFDDRLQSTYTIASRIDQELQRIGSAGESGSVVVGRAASGNANQVSQGAAVPMKLGR
ncbi:MAG: hypothetical protein A4E45_00897 [Methanosaeta sp. PtaB.Bin039]|nr:MAG: hypothetical protein A4E45_00897 [Methanosaeta sp. PtaB.Bin039]